jgi:hypothetical protein
VDPVKLAFEKAKAYRNSIETSKNVKIEQNPVEDSGGSIIGIVEKNKQVSDPVKGAVEYKTDIGVVGSSGVVEGIADSKTNSGMVFISNFQLADLAKFSWIIDDY